MGLLDALKLKAPAAGGAPPAATAATAAAATAATAAPASTRAAAAKGGGSPDAAAGAPAPAPISARARAVKTLVDRALVLDTDLLSGRFAPARAVAVVDQLLALRDRVSRMPLADLAAVSNPRSPLYGAVEDIAPFGNVDMWQAARRAALERRPVPPPAAPAPPPGPTGKPPGPSAPLDPNFTWGAGEEALDVTGRPLDTSREAAGNFAGTVTAALDALAMNPLGEVDVIAEMIALVGGEMVGVVAAPLLGVIVGNILLFESFAAADRVKRHGLEIWGARFALSVIGEPALWRPYPLTLASNHISSRIDRSVNAAWFHQQIDHALFGGGPVEMARPGMQRICDIVQKTVRNAEARPEVVSAYARVPRPAKVKLQQTLRAAIYNGINARAR